MKSALLCSFEEYYSEAEIIEEIVDYRSSSTICYLVYDWHCDIWNCMPTFVWELGFNILKNVVDHLKLVIFIKKCLDGLKLVQNM
jgi:hypothetical protein